MNMPDMPIRIGSGAAWWGDRIEHAIVNAEKGDLDYLCFETTAEATVSAEPVKARRDPSFPGYDTYLDERIKGALDGGVSRSLSLDNYGKPLSAAVLGFEMEVPDELKEKLRGMGA
jgi:Acyclic terpene utilisation family protein AtuA